MAAVLIAAVLGVASLASATTFGEIGDAPDLPPGQPTAGAGPLLRIHGAIRDSADVDMFCVSIVDVANFSASVVSRSGLDTQLYLFAGPGPCSIVYCPLAGSGVVHDDDTPPGGINQPTLTSAFMINPGPYYLAISGFNRHPVDGSGQLMWNDDPVNVERAADGPGAAGPVTGWTGFNDSPGEYWILLTGCEACDSNIEPDTWSEAVDAPETLPGQVTGGAGVMSNIFGELTNVNDVDLYCIRITNPAAFSATTSAAPDNDTQLSLFGSSGTGVALNDDGGEGLYSMLTESFVSVPGIYYLAISDFERTATGPGAGTIWSRIPNIEERSPDGTEPNGTLSGWIGTGAGSGFYAIQLTGATFSNTTDVPSVRAADPAQLFIRPSPFMTATTIAYSLQQPGVAHLRVFDIGGRLVRTLVDGPQPAGQQSVQWDGCDERGLHLPTGVYSVRLETSAGASRVHGSRRIILLR